MVSNLSQVAEIMSVHPVTVSVDTPATKVRSIFREEGYRAIPVVSKGNLEGIITRGDMMSISSTKSNIEARGIMENPPVIAYPEMDMMKLSQELLKAEQIQAPVIKSAEDRSLVGIVSVVDILRKLLYNGTKPFKKILADIITEEVTTCDYQDPLSKVWNKMDETGFSGLPVLKKNKLIGMITRKDLINSGHVRIGRESGEITKAVKVEKVMKTPPIAAIAQTKIQDAANIMIEYDVGRLPVVENPKYLKKEVYRVREADLIGIVAREDILGAYMC